MEISQLSCHIWIRNFLSEDSGKMVADDWNIQYLVWFLNITFVEPQETHIFHFQSNYKHQFFSNSILILKSDHQSLKALLV